MGKKLDVLLRRSFKTSKFKATVAMAVSRLAVLRNQRHARCSIARSDVVEFLKNNSHERALLRVEQVIKEQNMLDVFVLVEGYCHLLVERVHLFEQQKVCPEELKEAVSTLIYVASRCGEFPELQQIRSIFASHFGRDFAARAVELRNNCGVNPKIIQKLSTRMPSLESKMKVLKEIASENNIDLPIEETAVEEYKEESYEKTRVLGPPAQLEGSHQEENLEAPSNPGLGPRRKYRDVADAAQAAFESAAYAAAAARAAVELSRPGPFDPSGPTRTEHQTFEMIDETKESENILNTNENAAAADDKGSVSCRGFDSSDENAKRDGEVKVREIVFDDESDEGHEGFNRADSGDPWPALRQHERRPPAGGGAPSFRYFLDVAESDNDEEGPWRHDGRQRTVGNTGGRQGGLGDRRGGMRPIEGGDASRWESGFRVDILEFNSGVDGSDFVDWWASVEAVLKFKGVPDDRRVALVATGFRGRAATWWMQLTSMRHRQGRSEITSLVKFRKLVERAK
ncbi:Regulator of Vps4 activity in the MVB pathway protein [Striga hermonthica]|uniref:Regulator of Vps4 activity in the MVB pathway protein n=1 Tax=Striga hermonthica TaxID=68872 RepID=A0A9N7N0N1_STRHE|nr:Regulator of Vps4 activity in the MVB pathway protein [Striga hermonthica]